MTDRPAPAPDDELPADELPPELPPTTPLNWLEHVNTAYSAGYAAGSAAENAACAAVCDERAESYDVTHRTPGYEVRSRKANEALDCAAAIRARRAA